MVTKVKNSATECVLTRREIEYLKLAATGHKNKEIALILTVSISTVKKTFENIFRKFNAKDRTHAVTIAFVHKILTPEILNESMIASEQLANAYKLTRNF